MEWMRDQVWQFIGVAIAVAIPALGLITPIIYRKAFAKRKKDVQYELITSISLLHVAGVFSNEKSLQLTYQGNLIPGLFAYEIRITNIGQETIEPNDYAVPMYIKFKEGKNFRASISKTRNPAMMHLFDSLTIDDEKCQITLPKIPLNPNDWFEIIIFVEHSTEETPQIHGHIVGIEEIRSKKNVAKHGIDQLRKETLRENFPLFLMSVYILLTIIPLFIAGSFGTTSPLVVRVIALNVIIAVIAYPSALLKMYRQFRSLKK